jgi:ankyrin repeat protein
VPLFKDIFSSPDELDEALFNAVTRATLKPSDTLNDLLSEGRNPITEGTFRFGDTQQDLSIVNDLLSKGANPNNEVYGVLPLHKALEKGMVQLAKLLLMNKTNPDLQEKCFGRTPLHTAVLTGQREAMELLISHGANLNIEDMFGNTPLSSSLMYISMNHAYYETMSPCMNNLILAGANIKPTDITLAEKGPDSHLVEMLKQKYKMQREQVNQNTDF